MISLAQQIGQIVGALFIIMALTYLYKENPLFRIAEHAFVSLSLAVAVVGAVQSLNSSVTIPVSRGNLVPLIPLLLGCLLLLRYIGKGTFLSRWPMALLTGVGCGLAIRGLIDINFIQQVTAAITPQAVWQPYDIVMNLIVLAMTISVIVYFMFLLEHRGIVGKIARFGRISMMIYFGSSLGITLLGYTTLNYLFRGILEAFGIKLS